MISPNQGLISRILRNVETRAHVLREDVLGLLWRIEERNQGMLQSNNLPQLFGVTSRKVRLALRRLLKQGAVQVTESSWTLTSEGRRRATTLVRSHRLWEVYLEQHYPQDTHQLHHAASRLEHVTTEEMKLQLGDADVDPHGSRVPDDEPVEE